MIASLRSWLAGRSTREQQLIGVAAVLAVLTLLWFGIIRPIGDGLASAKARHASAAIRLANAEGEMAAIKPLMTASAPSMSGTLEQTIRDRATQAGFELTSVSPQGGDAIAIGIGSAKSSAFFAWVADLERDGFLVDQMTTTDNGDQTLSVALTLRPRRP